MATLVDRMIEREMQLMEKQCNHEKPPPMRMCIACSEKAIKNVRQRIIEAKKQADKLMGE